MSRKNALKRTQKNLEEKKGVALSYKKGEV